MRAGPSSVLKTLDLENGRAGPSSVFENGINREIEVKDLSVTEDKKCRAGPSPAEDRRKGSSPVLTEHLEQKKERQNVPKLRPVGHKSRPQTASNQIEAVSSPSKINLDRVLDMDAPVFPEASSQQIGGFRSIGNRIRKPRSSKPLVKNKLGVSFKKPKQLDDLEATPPPKILGKRQLLMHKYLAPTTPKDQ